MNLTEFYERYWQQPEPEPEQGQLVEPRKRMLRIALTDLRPGAQVLDFVCGSGAESFSVLHKTVKIATSQT